MLLGKLATILKFSHDFQGLAITRRTPGDMHINSEIELVVLKAIVIMGQTLSKSLFGN